ncbi:unnamed protein product [Parnassius mnemosyne]|uniref:RNA-directed DNA polymerase n=2 Tax=Parnassius mnemosyne TaxID=213953 RepID=A0AAV1LRD7_9NEOP
MRARPLAYALRAPVERALEQLVADGILTPVDRSDWATPIVPVVKKDGNIRICADYKLTLNKVIEVDRYPLPRVEDLLVRLQGGQRFSKIDLSQAYAQFVLDESAKYTVINTHKGLFRYNRLVYGLSSSPGIFQKHLEQLFNLPYVGVFLDDIIITGRNTEEHISNLHKVFDRLQSYGLRVKKEKCVFFAESVNYLGYVISKDGIHTCPDKIKAIVDTPVPTNVSELRAYIGMIMYYAKFVKNISTILAPLYNLLRTGIKFDWCDDCQRAFKKVKELLSSSKILMHYSSDLPIVLTCDASSVGVGAVISHLTPEGERPVAYASRSLTAAERAYSQIDREALAIVFGVRKYHQYLYGRKFILRTDHKPLTHIFGKKTGIPVMAASRIQRWAVLLSGYDYNIEYVTSNKNCADGLSRLPISSNNKKTINREITYINFVENFLPVTNEDVTKATSKDIILSRIFAYIKSGWPTVCPGEEVKPYFVRRNELYLDNGSIMWGYRMVIPSYLRPIILKQLHSSHMGIVKTKGLARSYVWWPNIDADVEALCRSCETCASEADAPPRAPPNPWPYLPPWSRVHIDFLGPYKGKTYLVLIDSSSKWLEIIEVARTNATSIVKVLRSIFARFGLPLELVSDQGPPFTSIEFKSFLKNNGIQQRFSPAYHPASNGAAENAVKLCKRAIKKAYRDDVDIDTALQTFLLSYRNSKQSTTGESPAMLLQRRSLRSRLDLLRGGYVMQARVLDAQQRQVEYAGGVPRNFSLGDTVWSRDYGTRDKWVKGTVAQKEGSGRYVLDNGDGRLIKRHIDQIRRRSRLSDVTCPDITNEVDEKDEDEFADASSELQTEVAVSAGKDDVDTEHVADTQCPSETVPGPATPPQPPPPSRPVTRSRRIRKPVIKFQC